jgi:hypothetical protein
MTPSEIAAEAPAAVDEPASRVEDGQPDASLAASQVVTLIARLEAATGPDRAIDWAIWQSIWGEYSHPLDNYALFTQSLDAALTLVPEGWRTDTVYQSLDRRRWTWALRIERGVGTAGNAPTPALALVIAALKARAQ